LLTAVNVYVTGNCSGVTLVEPEQPTSPIPLLKLQVSKQVVFHTKLVLSPGSNA
jgi:hypothetical protein